MFFFFLHATPDRAVLFYYFNTLFRRIFISFLSANQKPGPEVIKLFFLLINVKMLQIVGILTFMNGKNSILGLSEPKKAEFLDSFILMSISNFMLNSVEHEKS